MWHFLTQIYLGGLVLMLGFLMFIFWTSQGFKLSRANVRLVLFNSFLWPITFSIWLVECLIPTAWQKTFMRKIRDSHIFAFLQGAWERVYYRGDDGRSHATDDDWTEAYSHGMNLGDRILRLVGEDRHV